MDILNDSWSSFSGDAAKRYLKDFGSPSVNSKRILADVLREEFDGRRFSLLDLGCGNAQLNEFFREYGLECDYTGVDFSEPLLEAAAKANPDAKFIRDNVNDLKQTEGRWDVAVYSHVIEMLGAPEASLMRARELADKIAIRFFEPPEFEHDEVELRRMPVTEDGETVPYLRRKMSRDYYSMILARMGCRAADIYQDEHAKDQIHLLKF